MSSYALTVRAFEREYGRVWSGDVRFLWLSGPGSFLFAYGLSFGLALGYPSPAFGLLLTVAMMLAYLGGAVAFVFWLVLLAIDRGFRTSWRALLLGAWFGCVLQLVVILALGLDAPRLWLVTALWGMPATAVATGVTSFWPRGKKRWPEPV